MKSKILSVFFAFSLIVTASSNALAIDLGKKIEDFTKKAGNGSTNDAINLDGLKNIDEKITKKINEKIDDVTSDVKGQINEYKNKIAEQEKKITGIVDEVQGYVDQARRIKANAQRYIRIAKIIIGFLSCGILALIFMVWRLWRNIVTIKKTFKAVVNYDKIQKRIENLEKQVSELKSV